MMTLLFRHVSAWYLISEIPWKPLKCPTSYSALYMPVGKHAVCCRQWWPRSGTGSIYGIGTTTLRRSWFVAWRLRTREFWRHSNHLISQILQFCQNCTICWASRGQIYLIWNDRVFFMTRLETECWSSHAWCAWCHMRSTKFQLIESHSYKYITVTTIWIECCISRAESQISKFMGPTWGPPGSFRPQMGPMLAPWTLLSGMVTKRKDKTSCRKTRNRQIGC